MNSTLHQLIPGTAPLDSLLTGSGKPFNAPAPGGFLSFYGLTENPFADSVNPEFFYRTASHQNALDKMRQTVEYKVSLGLVTGPSGTGKTLLSQILLKDFQRDDLEAILVLVTPGLGRTGLLREILSELGVAHPANVSRAEDLVKLLSNTLIDLYGEGRRLVVIVDECHLLSSESLHMVRTISNLEIPTGKLASCLLFGEERFLKRLQNPSYASLRSRIFFQTELAAMSLADLEQYVEFRLLNAGRVQPVFSREALEVLQERSGGICRLVNKFSFLSLIAAADKQEPLISGTTVREASQNA